MLRPDSPALSAPSPSGGRTQTDPHVGEPGAATGNHSPTEAALADGYAAGCCADFKPDDAQCAAAQVWKGDPAASPTTSPRAATPPGGLCPVEYQYWCSGPIGRALIRNEQAAAAGQRAAAPAQAAPLGRSTMSRCEAAGAPLLSPRYTSAVLPFEGCPGADIVDICSAPTVCGGDFRGRCASGKAARRSKSEPPRETPLWESDMTCLLRNSLLQFGQLLTGLDCLAVDEASLCPLADCCPPPDVLARLRQLHPQHAAFIAHVKRVPFLGWIARDISALERAMRRVLPDGVGIYVLACGCFGRQGRRDAAWAPRSSWVATPTQEIDLAVFMHTRGLPITGHPSNPAMQQLRVDNKEQTMLEILERGLKNSGFFGSAGKDIAVAQGEKRVGTDADGRGIFRLRQLHELAPAEERKALWMRCYTDERLPCRAPSPDQLLGGLRGLMPGVRRVQPSRADESLWKPRLQALGCTLDFTETDAARAARQTHSEVAFRYCGADPKLRGQRVALAVLEPKRAGQQGHGPANRGRRRAHGGGHHRGRGSGAGPH